MEADPEALVGGSRRPVVDPLSCAGVSEDLKRNPLSGGVGLEGDGVSEAFEMGNEPAGGSFGIAAGEVVAARVGIDLAADGMCQ